VVDTVVDVSDVLIALEDSLKADTRTSRMLIRRMAPANTDPNKALAGWVGLYVDEVDYEPRALGTGPRSWKFEPTLRIIVQAVDRARPEEGHVKLEKHVKNVMNVVLTNRTLKELVHALTRANVRYAYQETDSDTMALQGALITLTFEGRTN
jgi:hypothetical protein